MRVIYEAEAQADVYEAVDYYQRQASVDRALDFLAAYDREVNDIARNPRQHAIVGGDVRRRNMNVYPYGIFYRVGSGMVTILAVRHHARRPVDWDRRP